MPEILVLRTPDDDIYDRVPVDEEDLGEKVEEIYGKLNEKYTLEILDDKSDRTKRR